ncbi:MAG TPA: DNA modification methylase [Bryobacteraceae bacterium]|jgi:DNA modification methylase|nr:DNA modification methylase [Bryobacteraceae bacterium]
MTNSPQSPQIQVWPIDKLVFYARNPRKNDAVVDQMVASLREFGFKIPVLARSDGAVVDGHLRLKAARKLESWPGGDTTAIPVILCDEWSPAQVKAFRLVVNRSVTWAEWDTELLSLELQELSDAEFDLSLTGFDEAELTRLLVAEEATAGLTDEDAVPEVAETPVNIAGDLWVLGQHRLLCGDATSEEAIHRVLAGSLADMTFCDPPYAVAYTGKTARKLTIQNDDLGAAFYDLLRMACTNMLAVTKGAVYICMSSSELHTLYRAFTDAGGHWSTFVIWAKHHFTLGRSDYQRQYEPILYGWRQGTDHFWCGDRNQGDVWFINRPMANLEHPTMKPVELVERAIRNSSKTRDTILDPFGGSGTTAIACEKTGRSGRLIEIDPQYADVIVRRWEQYTGKQAVLDGDGRTFVEIAQERHPGVRMNDPLHTQMIVGDSR